MHPIWGGASLSARNAFPPQPSGAHHLAKLINLLVQGGRSEIAAALSWVLLACDGWMQKDARSKYGTSRASSGELRASSDLHLRPTSRLRKVLQQRRLQKRMSWQGSRLRSGRLLAR
jgi:hypothetical protein